MTVAVVTIALISPWISPYNPVEQDMKIQHDAPSWAHPFGTDSYGRDQLSRILWGSRVSLVVGNSLRPLCDDGRDSARA